MNFKELRISYNNNWPERSDFPIEAEFKAILKDHNDSPGLHVARLKSSDDTNFHIYLGFLLDALDMLPMRPDLAFEQLWQFRA